MPDNREDAGMEKQNTSDEKKAEYEEYCYMCRRPERTAGKLIHVQGMFALCAECMQKAFDMMMQGNIPGMPEMVFPYMTGMPAPESGGQQTALPQTDGEQESAPQEAAGQKQEAAKKPAQLFPGLNIVTGADELQQLLYGGQLPESQRVKRRAKGEAAEPIIDIAKIPAPHRIKRMLDEFVVGQEYAKKAISVAVYNHYKRVAAGEMEIEIEKSNMLMIGPTGCGKTYLVKTLATMLDVPLAIADATSLTEAGYIGDDIESVLSKLLAAADNDVDRAEKGIVFIDEIDKLAKKRNTNNRDVSGESVQQGLLKLLEGSEVEVPVGATSKNAMVPMTTMNTKDILFICGGAFPDLEEIIKERLTKDSSMGFKAELKDRYDGDKQLLQKVEVEDLRRFGMIPEFLGRLPIVFAMEALSEEMMIRILTEPKNAIIKQYIKLLELDEVLLVFEEDALRAIAQKAMKKDTGARALRAIIEEFMLDIMYEIPKDDNIGRVVVTREYVEKTGAPLIEFRTL